MSDPHETGAVTDFADRMSYGDYLRLDRLLDAQHPLSDAPDEMLFIIQHQTSELWMKLMLVELDSARRALAADRVDEVFKMLARVARIMEQLNNAWDVLRTMTPSDYTTFRARLGQSSGFQSLQYRLIEFALGNRNLAMMQAHAHDPAATAALEGELARLSLYQEVLAFAARRGKPVPDALIAAPARAPHGPDETVTAMWAGIYRDTAGHWRLYEMAEKLVDLEDYFRRWRFNHVTTVERVIGFKRGTGGTAGVAYLKKMLAVELFPELWHVRTHL
ncbi:tryptophan 2,3-dioxygenase [Roseivivax sp. CAU 1753]